MLIPHPYRRRLVGVLLIAALLAAQLGCGAAERLRQPIADFEAATSVVTAQTRLAYGDVNRVARERAIKRARLLKKRLDPRTLAAETTYLTGDDLATRLEALSQLEEYAKLLSQIANSDAPERIATSAATLETSLNGLAARIQKLGDVPAGGGDAAAAEAQPKPNNSRFKEKFGIFSAVTREVLGFIARKKRDDAVKRAIRDGDAPVNDLVEALKLDLSSMWALNRSYLDRDIIAAFQAYNTEIIKPAPDEERLDEVEAGLIEVLNTQADFYATDPTEALDKMKKAHTKLVEYARDGSDENFTEATAAIQSFVESATRLGTAVIKLRTADAEKETT
jgi:hypothetical protein